METFGSSASVAEALHQMAESGRIPHAMLFHENDGGGAFPLVINFLEEVYGHNPRVGKLIHPDIHFVFPVAGSDKPVSDQFIGKWRELLLSKPCFFENELYEAIGIEGKQSNISVHEARSILDKLSLSAVEGGFRTVVVYLPEKLNIQAANTLLKMVEEPPEKTLFLLVTLQPERVLPTIFSRCLFLRVPPFSREEARRVHPQQGGEAAVAADLFHDLLDALVRRNLLGALETGEVVAALDSREKQKAFCKMAGEGFRNLFLLQQGLQELADIPEDEAAFYRGMAEKCRKSFPRQAMAALDRTLLLLERNVNQKILFADLAGTLYRITI
jgi:DNA polymerase-3 subunit delta'